MCKYFYTDLDITACKNILVSYSKNTTYEERVLELRHKRDYIIIDLRYPYIRITLKYKLKMIKCENKTKIEIEEINYEWFSMNVIFGKVMCGFFIVLSPFISLGTLVEIRNFATFCIFFMWIIGLCLLLKNISGLKTLKKEKIEADIRIFLKEQLQAEELTN